MIPFTHPRPKPPLPVEYGKYRWPIKIHFHKIRPNYWLFCRGCIVSDGRRYLQRVRCCCCRRRRRCRCCCCCVLLCFIRDVDEGFLYVFACVDVIVLLLLLVLDDVVVVVGGVAVVVAVMGCAIVAVVVVVVSSLSLLLLITINVAPPN